MIHAANHVGRDRPWRATEPNESGLFWQILPHSGNSLEHAFKHTRGALGIESLQIGRVGYGIENRPLAFGKSQALTQRIGDHQDVGEENRSIETETADRL